MRTSIALRLTLGLSFIAGASARPASAQEKSAQEKLAAAAAPDPEVMKLPQVKELPDPFTFNDGSKVRSPQDWERRRAELKELIQKYQYGHLPPAGAKVTAKELASKTIESLGSTERSVLLTIGDDGKSVSTHVRLSTPKGDGPFPAIIRGDLGWQPVEDLVRDEVVRRGYILAEFNREEIVPDKNERTTLLYAVHPDGDFGALAAWAWGFHRVLDHLLTLKEVDPKRIAVTGHSRGGKTALLAGAMDERIALTVPNNSGCGGAGSYRYQAPKSEDIGAILKNFPYWFHPKFGRFIGHVDRLPVDQHFVKALVAPRALLSTEALGDLWANPQGTQQTHEAAKEVYRFLGAPDRIGIYFREGEHAHNHKDWTTLLDFADKVFFGKETFDRRAFPDAPKAFSWQAP